VGERTEAFPWNHSLKELVNRLSLNIFFCSCLVPSRSFSLPQLYWGIINWQNFKIFEVYFVVIWYICTHTLWKSSHQWLINISFTSGVYPFFFFLEHSRSTLISKLVQVTLIKKNCTLASILGLVKNNQEVYCDWATLFKLEHKTNIFDNKQTLKVLKCTFRVIWEFRWGKYHRN